jgi:hypothetical protein
MVKYDETVFHVSNGLELLDVEYIAQSRPCFARMHHSMLSWVQFCEVLVIKAACGGEFVVLLMRQNDQ